MTPSHFLRLQTMLRSMTEVVMPALDPSNQLAKDQASLIIGNLKILLDQHDKTYQYELVELREALELLAGLEAASGTPRDPSLQRAEAIAGLPAPTEAELTAEAARVKAAADALLDKILTDGPPDARKTAQRLTLAQAERQITRERAWVKASGFEMSPEALPPLEELLAV